MSLQIKEIDMNSFTEVKSAVDILHVAFSDRLKNNLKFNASTITPESFFIKYAEDAIGLKAIVDNEVAAVAFLKYKHDSLGKKYAYFFHLGVLPKYARKGIGLALTQARENMARDAKCDYIEGDTATKAKSAVQIKIKNGYRICGLASFESTNYYSYIFRKALTKNCKWNNSFYCRYHYILSYFKCKLLLDKYGKSHKLGRIIRKFL